MNGVAVALEHAGGVEAGGVEAGTRSADRRVVERRWEGIRVILVNYCELYIQRPPNGFPSHSEGGDVARCVGIHSRHPIIRHKASELVSSTEHNRVIMATYKSGAGSSRAGKASGI